MEDIDAAFYSGVSRDLDEPTPAANGAPTPPPGYVPPPPGTPGAPQMPPGQQPTAPRESASRITLSGLLNALDGGLSLSFIMFQRL